MKLMKKLGILLCLLGLIMFLPPVANWLTLHLGDTVGHFSGMVSFVTGWAILGAVLAFSTGLKYQYKRIRKGPQ